MITLNEVLVNHLSDIKDALDKNDTITATILTSRAIETNETFEGDPKDTDALISLVKAISLNGSDAIGQTVDIMSNLMSTKPDYKNHLGHMKRVRPVPLTKMSWYGPGVGEWLDRISAPSDITIDQHRYMPNELQAQDNTITVQFGEHDIKTFTTNKAKTLVLDTGASYQDLMAFAHEYWCDHTFEMWYFLNEDDLNHGIELLEQALDENDTHGSIGYEGWVDDNLFRLVAWAN